MYMKFQPLKKCLWSLGLMLAITASSWGSEEGMQAMPKITAKKTYTIESKEQGETLQENRGYGEEEPMVRMMNLMMVEGSGMQGMDMSGMKMDGMKTASNDGGMKGMDQGSGHGDHDEVGAGHEMKSKTKYDPTSQSNAEATSYKVQAHIIPGSPKVGTNTLQISVQTKEGDKPATGLKIQAKVSMVSMDMGTEDAKVREISPGKYQAKVIFSMKGPWAVKLLLPKSGEKVFNFNAEK